MEIRIEPIGDSRTQRRLRSFVAQVPPGSGPSLACAQAVRPPAVNSAADYGPSARGPRRRNGPRGRRLNQPGDPAARTGCSQVVSSHVTSRVPAKLWL